MQVKIIGEGDEIESPGDEWATGDPVIDEEGGEIVFESPEVMDAGDVVSEPREKYYVNGVNVAILNERIQYTDSNGRLITGSLKEYTKRKVLECYRSLDDFLNRWNQADKKRAIIEEFTEQGIVYENLKEAIGKEMDIFDLVCHAAFDRPPLTRAERANNVKKRDYFTKYGEQARKVLEALLDKYADTGIENIEDMKILQVNPLDQFGSPMEIVKLFGGKSQYQRALIELENEIYKVA